MGANSVSAFGKAWGLAFGAAFGLVVMVPPDVGAGSASGIAHAASARTAPRSFRITADAPLLLQAEVGRKDFAQLFDAPPIDIPAVSGNPAGENGNPAGEGTGPLSADNLREAPLSTARVDIAAVPGNPGGSVGSAKPDMGIPITDKTPTTHQASNHALAPVDTAQAVIKIVADSVQSGAIPPDSAAAKLVAAQGTKPFNTGYETIARLDKHNDEALALILILAAIEATS